MSPASIVLIGPMGSGKTTVGRALADREHMNHLDLDEMIVAARGLTIGEIFEAEGEPGFRTLEHEALSSALARGPAVVSTGGGVVTVESNRDLLGGSGALIVWLDASVEVLTRRVDGDATRPLLAGDYVEGALRAIVAERADWYNEVADLRIDTSEATVEDCVDLIVAASAPDAPQPVQRPAS